MVIGDMAGNALGTWQEND